MVFSNGHRKLSVPIFGAVLILICLIPCAVGMTPKCRKLDPERKETLEAVLGRPFMGCSLSRRQSLRALSRMNWLSPPGEQASLDLASQKGNIRSELDRAGLDRGETRMVMMGLRMVEISVSKPGMLNVSTECVMGLEPDFVTMILADSRNPEQFNNVLARECQKKGIELDISARDLTTTQEVALIVRCVVWSAISLLIPLAGQIGLLVLKNVVSTVVVFVPCPSTAARLIDYF